MDLISDIFNGDAFSVVSLTDSINKIPFVPGRAGQVVDWQETSISTTTIMLEEDEGVLELINPTPRGGPGETFERKGRIARSLVVPHYQVDDYISADSVQNVRAFGQTNQLEVLSDRVNERLSDLVSMKLDPTLEYQRLGALKGVIVNKDTTILYNLFDQFGVKQEPEINFDLDNASPASGVLRQTCADVVRTIADNLGGTAVDKIYAECGDKFFDDLIAHPEVVASYKNTPMAEVLRQGYVTPNGMVYGVFEFGGILWENYRGSIKGKKLVDIDKCHIFPSGVPGLFRTVYAPADYEETVNTLGLPRYAKQFPTTNGKGRNLELQMNALSYCRRPKALMQGRRA
uniref:major capsid protein n=1 Tax=Xanthomonas albilineans TaxID=29447 RepID=UPI0027DBD61C|nr:major capsid protein [Xanthomonas albilineans]